VIENVVQLPYFINAIAQELSVLRRDYEDHSDVAVAGNDTDDDFAKRTAALKLISVCLKGITICVSCNNGIYLFYYEILMHSFKGIYFKCSAN